MDRTICDPITTQILDYSNSFGSWNDPNTAVSSVVQHLEVVKPSATVQCQFQP